MRVYVRLYQYRRSLPSQLSVLRTSKLGGISEDVILSSTSSRREPADHLNFCNWNVEWLSVLIFVVKGHWSDRGEISPILKSAMSLKRSIEATELYTTLQPLGGNYIGKSSLFFVHSYSSI